MTRRAPVSRGPRRRRLRRLEFRLLFWFFGAIVFALGASAVTTILTSGDGREAPSRVVTRHVQRRLATVWDDPAATDAYVAELRETTGLDLRVVRDASRFPHGRRARAGSMVFEDGVAYIPVVRRRHVVGALELRTSAPAPRLWRVFLALAVALLVLGAVARRVSKRLARPLEHLATTATRFGGGDLSARTGIDEMPRRWVAEEVRDVGRAFDGMADRIARVVRDQRELLGAISHELRSPLGRARVALEIARDRAGADTSDARALDDLERQLVEMDAILGDLLASARAGLADLRREEVELGAWLRGRLAQESGGAVELETDSGATARVSIDPALLGRALHNVLANAWAHGHPRDEPLAVSLEVRDGRAVVTVRDRGPGFSPEVLARAFEPFVTGGDAARSPRPSGAPGLGLGLTLVRRIVEAHGGVTSARNLDRDGAVAGAAVAFELPLAI